MLFTCKIQYRAKVEQGHIHKIYLRQTYDEYKTTKDQSGEIYNGYSKGGQRCTALSKQTSSLGYALVLSLFTAIPTALHQMNSRV